MAELSKTVLAIDTALGGVSVGIMASNGHIVSRMIETAREQAVILAPTIQEVVEEAQCEFSDIDLIVCSKGPGSFTGLRIGLATARTMALSLDRPLVGLTSLDIMARHYQTDKDLLIVLETKRQDFYARYYNADYTPLTEPMVLSADEVLQNAPHDDFVVGGDCLERFFEMSPCPQAGRRDGTVPSFECLENLTQSDPILMCQIGLEAFKTADLAKKVEPLYLRGADVSQPKNKPRQLAKA